MGNLRLLQQAYCYINDGSILDTDFHNYVLHLSSSYPDSKKHSVKMSHLTKRIDQLASLYFPNGRMRFYNSAHIGRLRLCTPSYAENKVADDSNVIFLLNGNEHPGRIRSIFTIDDVEPFLLIGYLSNLLPFSCDVDSDKTFHYPHIKRSTNNDWSFIPIHIKDFVEKIVFYTDAYGVCHFLRFPTLEHCS